MTSRRTLQAAAGIIGPLAFTAAWVVSSLRQDDYSVAFEHISGLAAPDARTPAIMTTGFLALGVCTATFAGALEHALGGRGAAGIGPHLVRVSGLGLISAGLLRRDRMLLRPPDEVRHPQSWRNDGHDIASGVTYATTVAAPLALAWRFRDDPAWSSLSTPSTGLALVSGGLLAVFASGVAERWNGILQRVAVTLPGLGAAAAAARMLRPASG